MRGRAAIWQLWAKKKCGSILLQLKSQCCQIMAVRGHVELSREIPSTPVIFTDQHPVFFIYYFYIRAGALCSYAVVLISILVW